MKTEVPITSHPKLPDEVPLIADFHDDRNRLSYYHPIVKNIGTVNTPITKFIPVNGSLETGPDIEYREITRFLQDQQMRTAFIRSDYCSAKLDSSGRRIDSQDPVTIETAVLEMIRQLFRLGRNIGGRIAVREWIPHDVEVRFFLRDGEILYGDTTDDCPEMEWPWVEARHVAREMDTFAWSCDFIRHEKTGKWYCIDMGLDGLYHDGSSWTAISGHLDESMSPETATDEMLEPNAYM